MSFKICNSIDGASTFHIFNNMHHFLRLRVNALIQHILFSMRQSIEHKKIEKLNLSFFAVFLNKINLMNINEPYHKSIDSNSISKGPDKFYVFIGQRNWVDRTSVQYGEKLIFRAE